MSRTTARDLILAAVADRRRATGRDTFSPAEIIARLGDCGYAESTLRTHIVSRMCADAPNNHATTHDDLDRVADGVYRLRR